MKKIAFTLLLVLISQLIVAQQVTQFPVINAGSPDDKPIELKRLKIAVFVNDNIAITTFEMQFYNGNDRVMEGELNFPLDNGVTISRFALEVNGEMREGVVIEKEKATQAFEAVIRQNIDPGIAEVTKGNNFKARVYPIPRKGYKTAIIAFEQELSGDNNNYIYQLPVNFKHVLEEFSVKVEVVMNNPQTLKGKHPSINLDFSEERESYISEYSKRNTTLDTQLAFSIPKPAKVDKVLTYKGEITSDNYFYINIDLKEESRPKPKPSKIAVIWDESSSGKNRDIQKEIDILQGYFNWMGNGTVELKTFSFQTHIEREFKIENGKCNGLIEFLKSVQYDGGTNLHILDFSNINADEILLFTDGISTFGKKTTNRFNAPIATVNSSSIADHNLLEYFATSSKGVYVNAFKLTGTEVHGLLQFQQKRFVKAEYNEENIKDFYPEKTITAGNNFSCAGKVEGAKNPIKLHFGYGNEITESHTVVIDNTKRLANSVGERIWAQKKLKSLLVEADQEQIIAHGKKYSLVTPGTSLIVLDRVEDYVNYEITPPASLLQEYKNLMAQQEKDNGQNRHSRLERLCKAFEEDVEWWNTVVFSEKHEAQSDDYPPPSNSPEIVEIPDEEHLDMVMDSEAVLEEVIMIRGQAAGVRLDRGEEDEQRQKKLSSTMELNKWDNNALYMNELKATDPADLYKVYLKLKAGNSVNPSFYFDVATYMFRKSERENGLRVISNLAELELENAELLRTLGRKLAELKFYEEAIAVFQEVLGIRSFEPHSYIDLGLTYAEMGEYQKAVDNLYTVIDKDWDNDIISRFSGIEIIVLHDINNIIHQNKKVLDISAIEECFIKHMPVDIRVVIDWDANNTDIDLWVTDPLGEKCSYQNTRTQLGGKISNDITMGYGPEEFRLKKAKAGKYKMDVNFFGSNQQTVLGNVTVRAIVYTAFGSENEHKEVLTLQLAPDKKGDYNIGAMVFGK